MTLKIKVQVDRLPDIDVGGVRKCQLGLRVSAVIVSDPGQPVLSAADASLIQPWHWRDQGGVDGSWNAHDRTNWTLWIQQDVGDPVAIPAAAVEMAPVHRSDFDTGQAPGRYRQRIAQEVAAILAEAGLAALQEPLTSGIIRGRTVYGLVESQTALPSPVPACMKVWTAVTLDSTLLGVGEDTVFFAAPSFEGPNGVHYAPSNPAAPAPAEGGAFTLTYAATGPGTRGASASIYPSLPMRQLRIGTDDPERLIDLSTLWVRRGGPDFESSDWNSALVGRVAALIDPSARVMAVLDETIRASVAHAPAATRTALRHDLLPDAQDVTPDRLRRVLAALYHQVSGPRMRSSRSSPAPAAAFLERLALSDPTLWPAVAPLLFAHAGAEDTHTAPRTPPHVIVSRARLAQLAGIEVGRQGALDDDPAIAQIDGEPEFRAWLLQHWTTAAEGSIVTPEQPHWFAGSATRMAVEQGSVVASAARTGVINLMQIDAGTTVTLPFSLGNVAGRGLPATVAFALGVAERIDSAAPICTLLLPPPPREFALDTGGKPHAIGPSFADGVLTLSISVTADGQGGKTFQLNFTFTDAARKEVQNLPPMIDITALARSGRLAMRVTLAGGAADAALRVGIKVTNAPLERLRGVQGPAAQGQAMRTALALAYGGPAIAPLLAGWVPIAQRAVTQDDIDNGAVELHQRLRASVARYVDEAFQPAFDRAGAADAAQDIDKQIAALNAALATAHERDCKNKLAEQIAGLAALRALMGDLWRRAIADAKRLAAQLVPPAAQRDADRITQDALPLSFTVDQLQDFDDTADLWTRLAGLGVLIGREHGGATQWWSLNPATLHVSRSEAGNQRAPLGADNAVWIAPQADWWKAAQVDPVPLVVTEVQGVRNAVIRYENQSIVAEMQSRPQLDPHGQARSVTRRPEALLFPVAASGFPKLPALTFGRTYSIMPYLIGHGGVVPVALRTDVRDPSSAFGAQARSTENGAMTLSHAAIKEIERTKRYLRTVPVGAPRLRSALPGQIAGVAPLAAELPLVPPPLTLHDGMPVGFFLDNEHATGTLHCPPGMADDQAGVRIDVAGIAPAPGARLELVVRKRDATGEAVLLEVALGIDALKADGGGAARPGLRIDVIGTRVQVSALLLAADACAEDEPEQRAVAVTVARADAPVARWQSAMIELSIHGAHCDVIAPAIRWGNRLSDTQPDILVLHGPKPLFPAELVTGSRDIIILDGIGRPAERTGPSRVLIALERPSTPLATYDRWINGALSGYGAGAAGDADSVRKALNRAAEVCSSSAPNQSDRSLDDPAVEAIVFEVVQCFPTREIVRAPALLGNYLTDLRDVLGMPGGRGAAAAQLAVVVADDVRPAAAGELGVKHGHIYELRFYGAIPASQEPFATGVATRARFAPAAMAGWRNVDVGGRLLQLGAPLVLTIEVASARMPALYASVPPFYLTLRRPPHVTRDQAVVRLAPDWIEAAGAGRHLRYQALRMVDRIGVLEQRWAWRGRPHPELAEGTITQFGTDGKIAPSAREYVDAAFFGRAHDDIGPIVEVTIGRPHVYCGRARFPSQADPGWAPSRAAEAPVVHASDLDHNGGANLWRYAIRAKSRYAAMRQDDPAMLRFSHVPSVDDGTGKDIPSTEAEVHWWPLVVPDRAGLQQPGRAPKRPNLMLVVPLTEPIPGDSGVPPLLALFNEPMFPLFHAGDAIEAVVDVARHPFPALERIPSDDAARAAFRALWETVEAARAGVDALSAALDRLLEASAEPAPGAIGSARAALADQQRVFQAAAKEYAEHAGKASALGYVEHLEKLKLDVAKKLDDVNKKLADGPHTPAVLSHLEFMRERYCTHLNRLDVELDLARKTESTGIADAGNIGNPMAKYLPEAASDPIRTGQGASGKPLAIRCDGPVGYTFDPDAEGGRFDHASLLVSPVAHAAQPWSLVKLRFRRLETPELMVGENELPTSMPVSLGADAAAAAIFRLSASIPAHDCPVNVHCFNATHEGLAVDSSMCNDGAFGQRRAVQVSFDDPTSPRRHFVRIDMAIVHDAQSAPRLEIAVGTQLGVATPWSVPLSFGTAVEVRLVVSQQATPIGRRTPGDKETPVPPRGDVSVRVRITPPPLSEAPGSGHEHGWLSVICLPLTSSNVRAGGPPTVALHGAGSQHQVRVSAIRLSEFTPAIWCQFAAAMSHVKVSAKVKTAGDTREISQVLPVTDLSATVTADGTGLTLALRQVSGNESLTGIGLTAPGRPDQDAQVEECLYALVTRYVYDAFDRMRERVHSIHRLPDSPDQGVSDVGKQIWLSKDVPGDLSFKNASGRIRIVYVLRGKTREFHGFESAPREFPDDFFGVGIEDGESIAESPSDAAGQVLGISQPFNWTQT